MEGRVCLVDRWSFEVPKTKAAVAALWTLGLDGKVLVVISNEDVVAERSFGNLSQVNMVEASQLTAYDVVVSDWVVFTDETIPGEVIVAPEGVEAFNSARREAPEAPQVAPVPEEVPAEQLDEVVVDAKGDEAGEIESAIAEDQVPTPGDEVAGQSDEEEVDK
jgi:hypothetical protein